MTEAAIDIRVLIFEAGLNHKPKSYGMRKGLPWRNEVARINTEYRGGLAIDSEFSNSAADHSSSGSSSELCRGTCSVKPSGSRKRECSPGALMHSFSSLASLLSLPFLFVLFFLLIRC